MLTDIIEVALIGLVTLYTSTFTKPEPIKQPQPTPTIKQAEYTLQAVSKPTIVPSVIANKSSEENTALIQATETPKISFPSQLLDLTNWKITLPLGDGKPLEIKQPNLSSYKIDPWFIVHPIENAVRFRASVTAATTSGSKYPRSELREMTNNGTTNASWSSSDGTHTMFLDQAITAVPQTKKHVVAGQIHDADDDVIVIRLEFPNLYVNVDGQNAFTLDSNYSLGKKFKVKFIVSNGQTKVFYNDGAEPVFTLDKNYSGAYFKAGAYTQSNCTKEPSSLCTEDNFGEVVVYDLAVNHR